MLFFFIHGRFLCFHSVRSLFVSRISLNGLFPFRPIPFHPFPFRPNFPVLPILFTPFPTLPFSHFVLPFYRFTQFHFAHFLFRPEGISPKFPISPDDHFALFPQGPFPFRPNAIFLISGPKTNEKSSNNLIPQFWTLFLGLLLTAHITDEEDILVKLCFFYQYGYSYDKAYFREFLGI